MNSTVGKDGFRFRGVGMSRLDAFSDVVFGFALTLIVVSLEVPKTFAELRESLLGFLPFSVCFLFFMMIWWTHFRFFRRYGLHDFATVVINSILLLLVLFFVFPLKFMFSVSIGAAAFGQGAHIFTSAIEIRQMMELYAFGFAAVYLALTALFINAWRLRDDLHLNPLERVLTIGYILQFGSVVVVSVIVGIVARLVPPTRSPSASFFFLLIGVCTFVQKRLMRKPILRAESRTTPQQRIPLAEHH